MDKISSIIEIKSAYSTQVNLREEYDDYKVNLERMERYMPIRSHRAAFEKIARALLDRDSKRFFLLTGSYGTGKSHLSLMLANYLTHPSTAPEIETFFENFAQMTVQDGESLNDIDKWKIKRKMGKFLVCICDYDSDNSFMEIILKSIKTALEREGIDSSQLATPYREAVRKIEEWKRLSDEGSKNFYSDFERLLMSKLPGTTPNQFIKALDKDLDSEKLQIFRQIHKDITTVDFMMDKNNLVEIVKDLVQSPLFLENFQGIAILFDEFDYILKEKQRFGSNLNVFQAFGEYCSKSFINGTPVFMLATGHRSFISYKSRYNEDDFSVVNNRVEEVSLKTEGFEDIISAIVIPNKNSETWKQYIRPNRNVFDSLTQSCREHDIFSHLSGSGKKLREKIIENIYPMHPMATHVLLELSKDIASNNRSVFTFFTKAYRNSSDEGSYNWYTHTHEILDGNGNLNFYTVDYLFRYFSQLISSDNLELPDSKKTIIRNFEASLREWKKVHAKEKTLIVDENEIWAERILQTLVLYHLANVVPNATNILFGLNANANLFPELAAKIKSILKYLADKHILFYNKQSDAYEFKKNDILDIDGLVEDYVSKEEHYNFNVVDEFTRIGKIRDHSELYQIFRDDFYYGKAYNLDWTEDKRFLRVFATVKELEGKNFFEKISKEMFEEQDYTKSYEGISIVVICESLEERDKARSIAMHNKNSRILIGVPRNDILVKEHVAKYIALEHISNSSISEQEFALVQDKKNFQAKLIADQLNQYSDQKNIIWCEKEGNVVPVAKDEHSAVSFVLQKLYENKRSRIKHPDLNKNHSIEKNGQNVLKDAVNRLLDFEHELSWDTSKASDTSDMRVFHSVLAAKNVLVTVEQNKNIYKGKFNSDFESYRESLPALTAMFLEIEDKQKSIPFSNIIKIAQEYGVGRYAFLLYFSIILRYYDSALYLKSTPNSPDILKIRSYIELEDLIVKKKYPNAVIDILQLTEIEKNFVNSIYQIYATIPVTKNITIDQCYSQLMTWYESLPNVSKISSVYSDTRFHNLINVFSTMKNYSMPNFIICKLQTIIGRAENDLLTDTTVEGVLDFLRSAKIEMPNTQQKILDNIFEQVTNLFNPNYIGKITEEAARSSLINWYDSLTEVQKDTSFQKHTPDSKIVVNNASSCINAVQTLSVNMPEQLLQQKVLEWSTDKTADLIHKIKHAKIYVEQNIVDVEDPVLIIPDTWIKVPEGNQDIYYYQKGSISIKCPNKNYTVLYTDDGNNPLSPSSNPKELKDELSYTPLIDEFILQLVSIDEQNRKGFVRRYKFRAEKLRFQARPIIKEHQAVMNFGTSTAKPEQEPEESIMIPSIPYDNNSLEICMKSIIQTAVEKKNISNDAIRETLLNMLRSLGE
jgi:hypothetical protein